MSHNEYLNQMAYNKTNKGHNINFYHFKLYDIEEKTYHYFKESSEILQSIGIKKGSLYNMIKNIKHTCPKWKRYEAYSIREPIFSKTIIKYPTGETI